MECRSATRKGWAAGAPRSHRAAPDSARFEVLNRKEKEMAKLAFLGLGHMGAPMATRLFDAGNDLTVWNRTRDRAAALGQRGARVAASPADAARGAEVAITMLASPEALQEVFSGR